VVIPNRVYMWIGRKSFCSRTCAVKLGSMQYEIKPISRTKRKDRKNEQVTFVRDMPRGDFKRD